MKFKKTMISLTASLALFGVVAPVVNSNNAQAVTRHVTKKVKKVKKRKIPVNIVAGSQPTDIRVTKRTLVLAFNLKTGKMHHTYLQNGQYVTMYPGTYNTWILTKGVDNAWAHKHYRYVVRDQSGWYITKEEENRRIQNYRNKFNSSLGNRVGSKEYNSRLNELNADKNNIKGWIINN